MMQAELTTTIDPFNYQIEELGVKLTLTPSKRKKVKKINVTIEGIFTLNNASFVKDKISEVFSTFDTVDIALRNISQIDLASIQVLYYIKKSNEINNKQITLDADLSKEDRSVVFNSGMMELLSRTKLTD